MLPNMIAQVLPVPAVHSMILPAYAKDARLVKRDLYNFRYWTCPESHVLFIQAFPARLQGGQMRRLMALGQATKTGLGKHDLKLCASPLFHCCATSSICDPIIR